MQQTKFTETATDIMTLYWFHDTNLARHYFDDFLIEYERLGCSDTYKRKGYACKDLTVVRITGYSQGDVVWVKVPHADDTPAMRDYFTHIFYDAPICASVSIEGGQDYQLDEFYEDIYDSSRDALIKAINASDMPADVKARALVLVPNQNYASYD
jgi:hypothetical protein